MNLASIMWAAGIAMRFRSIQAGPLMQTPTFLILFLAPVYVPLNLLTGWVESAASINPVTAVVQAGRELISGGSPDLGLAYAGGHRAGGRAGRSGPSVACGAPRPPGADRSFTRARGGRPRA